MRRLLLGLTICACLASTAIAQLTATLTINTFTKEGGNYSFDVWGRRTNATGQIFVGISSFYFTYNAAALGAPSLSNINSKFTGDGTENSNYGPMSAEINAGKIAVTVNFTGLLSGSGSTLATTAPYGERICTVTLPITDGEQTAQLGWDEVNSAISTSNSQPVTHTYDGADNGPLPIQLVSLKAVSVAGMGVKISWSTASETDNYGFYVQKSQDDMNNYQTIENSFVAGHGTAIESHSYSFTDANATSGLWYYRLQQVDRDGTVHYSDGIRADGLTGVESTPLPTVFALDQNYPNPFNPSTMITYALPQNTRVSLVVYNTLGQAVQELVNGEIEAGYHSVQFNATELASGIYFYRLTTEQKTDVKRMLLIR
jgi:hypothetical protein